MLVNCKNCERAFNQVGPEKLCSSCRETYLKLFQYMAENPTASLKEIEDKLEIGAEEVKIFLRHGRFVAFEGLSRQLLKCRHCEAEPDHGELCGRCFELLVGELVDELAPGDAVQDSGQKPAERH